MLKNPLTDSSKVLLIDGATGTEIQSELAANNIKRRKSEYAGWSCCLHEHHPETVRKVHSDYVDIGANIIIANTYACNGNVLAHVPGFDLKDVHKSIIKACELAHESKRGKKDVYIAGSISSHPPHVKPGSLSSEGNWPSVEQEVKNYQEATKALVEGNVDFIFIEMCKELVHGPRVVKAVADSKHPFFLGLSTRLDEDGNLFWYAAAGLEKTPIPFNLETLSTVLSIALKGNLIGINIMHTKFDACEPTLKVLLSHSLFSFKGKKPQYSKPILGVYPDHGTFRHPHWDSHEINYKVAEECIRTWVTKYGVNMVGGCCGLGREFIRKIRPIVQGLTRKNSNSSRSSSSSESDLE